MNAIEVQGLRKAFGEVIALDGLDLVGPEGDVLALLGVRAFAGVNPITLCVDAVRALIGGSATEPVLGTLAWLASLSPIFIPFAVGRYRALE
jgi:hypothetical protein